MEEKVKATIGVFAGIINQEGKLLLRRRRETSSIIPGKSFKGCWELPGGGVMIVDNMPYHHLVNELKREVKEETGVELKLEDPMPAMYSVFFGKNQDLALVVPIRIYLEQTKKETRWVSFDELNELARVYKPVNKETGEDGEGLVSGEGKRMHCMALKCFSSGGSTEASLEATKMLIEFEEQW